jgi:hypothetical protein
MNIDHLRKKFSNETVVGSFLNPSSGKTVGAVLIAATPSPVGCMGLIYELGFMSVTAASGNLR